MVMSDGERTRHPHKLECQITDLTQVERHPYRASDIQTTTIPRTYSLAAI